MRYQLLGRSGLRVSELCLGTMTFGEEWGWGASKEESRKIFDAFAEAGGTFIDTANRYTDGTSEKITGELVASDRERFVLATKYTLAMRDGDPNAGGNHRKSMVQSVEASLRRLGTDYVDLLWLHIWDGITPVDEVMRALDDLVRAGKVLYVGVSDAPAWWVAQANTIADFRGWSPFVALQIEYSLVERTPERELLPMAEAFDLAILDWSPLGGGVLTGKYLDASPDDTRLKEGARHLSEHNNAIARTVVDVAEEAGMSPAQVAINWVRQQTNGQHIPILGARTLDQLKDNLGVLDHPLSDEHLARLDGASAIELGFPHDFYETPTVQRLVYSNLRDRIDA